MVKLSGEGEITMEQTELGRQVLAFFKEHFADSVLNVGVRFLPHEAFVEVRVKEISEDMKVTAQALEAEFDELGRRVTIGLIRGGDARDW
jgi:hypothetical protein